jgi:hypothetical protein
MGKFSEAFKLSERIKNADFSDDKTRKFWTRWANEVIDRVSVQKSGTFRKSERVEEVNRVDKFDVSEEDQVLEVGSFEQTKLLGDPIEKL